MYMYVRGKAGTVHVHTCTCIISSSRVQEEAECLVKF